MKVVCPACKHPQDIKERPFECEHCHSYIRTLTCRTCKRGQPVAVHWKSWHCENCGTSNTVVTDKRAELDRVRIENLRRKRDQLAQEAEDQPARKSELHARIGRLDHAIHRTENPEGEPRPWWEVPAATLIFIAAIGVVLVLMVIVGGAILGEDDECDRYDDRIAEQVTILQMADESLGFSEALRLAEGIEGPPPSGC